MKQSRKSHQGETSHRQNLELVHPPLQQRSTKVILQLRNLKELIRSDLVPILHKIWRKHGHIIERSTMRSGHIIARALESLATMVEILENSPVESISDSQAGYLSTTLSDLKTMCFKVHWLVSFVEKAVKLHKSKPLVDSLKKLSDLSSQVQERRAILVDELAKLTEEENKLKKEMGKMSKLIPFSKVKFGLPLGSGLT
ncbi:hypothetical protein RND81_14G171800 [Saponaria officinalis]|uniref:Uncharacterized protein n=1 Tax=Saponaria officinalis TaxID=3572 RepID=A0AAW1GUY1_SAPOF